MKRLIDLHVHSSCSDGTLTPSELVSCAVQKGLAAFALTDHDTTAGLSEAAGAARAAGIELIPGIELSTEYGGRDIHILGLGIDRENAAFQAHLAAFRASRDLRNEKMIQKLSAEGIRISQEDMQNVYPDCVWTRAHFAAYLLEHGYVHDRREAFDRYLGDHARCFVPREKVTPLQAIELIHRGGGCAVLAHPLLYHMSQSRLDELAALLAEHGLDGLEAVYSANTPSDEAAMRALASKYGLCITGGSDFHGANKPGIELGSGRGNLAIPYTLWELLRARLPRPAAPVLHGPDF